MYVGKYVIYIRVLLGIVDSGKLTITIGKTHGKTLGMQTEAVVLAHTWEQRQWFSHGRGYCVCVCGVTGH